VWLGSPKRVCKIIPIFGNFGTFGTKVTTCFNQANDTILFAGAKYFDMYPGVMGFDVTNGTIKEKQPMARGTVKTSDNRNVPIFNALLPSISSWVFRWIFHDSIPKLLSKESLSNLRLILVDEDYHCNGCFFLM
jgi:hypothetical protein